MRLDVVERSTRDLESRIEEVLEEERPVMSDLLIIPEPLPDLEKSAPHPEPRNVPPAPGVKPPIAPRMKPPKPIATKGPLAQVAARR